MKTCPDCAEEVQDAARVCKHCGYRFAVTPRVSEQTENALGSLRRGGRRLAEGARKVADDISASRERTRERINELEGLAREQGVSEPHPEELRSIARQALDNEKPLFFLTGKPNWRRRRSVAVTDQRIVSSDPKGETNLRLEDLTAVSAESKMGRGRLQLRTKGGRTEVFAAVEPEIAAGRVAAYLREQYELPEIEKSDKKAWRPSPLKTVGLAVVGLIILGAIVPDPEEGDGGDQGASRPASESSARNGAAGGSSHGGGGQNPAREFTGRVESEIISDYPEVQSASCRPTGFDLLDCRVVVGPTPSNPYGSTNEYIDVRVSPAGSWEPLGPVP